MARAKSSALLVDTEAELEAQYAHIADWYRRRLSEVRPPMDLPYDPVLIGPTWRWDKTTGWELPERSLGWRLLGWCGHWLRDNAGNPWEFTPEQARFWLWYYALDERGRYLYHSAVLQRLKGHGKDPFAACVSAAACFGPVRFDGWDADGNPKADIDDSAWVQLIATSQEQTKNTMKLFPSLMSNPEFRKRFGIQLGRQNVWGLGDRVQIEAITSSYLSIEGGRPTQIIRNETQNWNTSNQGHEMAGAIEGNAAKSPGGAARMLDVCNAYRPGEDSVGERVREGWEASQGADATTADFGLLYDSLEAPPDAPLTLEAAPDVIRSVAGDSYWLDTEPDGRIVKSIANPSNPPSESRRKWYNQITATADAWVLPADWDQCKAALEVADGEQIVMFLDASKSDDATALIGCRVSDGHVFRIGIWQRPANAKPHEWLVDRDDVDYRVLEAEKKWTVVAFWADLSDARDDETGERYWEAYADGWGTAFGRRLRMPAVLTGPSKHPINWDMRNPAHAKTFTEHAERFASDVSEHAITHDGNELLRQHVRNARRRPGKYGIGLGKEHRESARKVDAAVAAVGARMMWRLWLAQQQGNGRRAPGKGRVITLD